MTEEKTTELSQEELLALMRKKQEENSDKARAEIEAVLKKYGLRLHVTNIQRIDFVPERPSANAA